MRSTLRSLLPLALVLAVSGCKSETNANERRVVILFTTDEHSQLYASWPELDDFLGVQSASLQGGVERRMTVLEQQRTAAKNRGAGILTLSSGDFSQGSLASAAWLATSPELSSMKKMGYDAVSLGNHEFDLGADGLFGSLLALGSENGPPLVLSNFLEKGTLAAMYGTGTCTVTGFGTNVPCPIAPYRILTTSNGLRIGIVASMGVEAGTVAGAAPANAFWDATATTTEAQFASVAAHVQAQVNAARAQGVDAVILLAHGGIGPDQMHPGEDELLALQLKGVDLILSGHSHGFTPQPRIVYGSGTAVPVVQPKPYGRNVGKVELVFTDDGKAPRPYLDPHGTEFFDVNGTVAKTTDAIFRGDLQARTIGFLEFGLDGPTSTALPSFLESTLTKVVGAPVTADAAHPGNLWNFPMGTGLPDGCKLAFDVTTQPAGESNAMNLDTDAILAAVNDVRATDVGIQSFGPVRGPLLRGTTSEIAFADVYHMAPLGGDPTAVQPTDLNPATNAAGIQAYLNAVPGYPLVRINIPSVAVRLALEGTLQAALAVNGDFFLGTSGLVVHYDLARTPFDTSAVDLNNPATLLAPGWVTYMELANGTVMYNIARTDWATYGFFNPAMLAPTSFVSVATTFYVAKFASAFGIPIYNGSFQQITTDLGLVGAVVRRADQSDIKDYEALAQFIREQCAGNTASPGFLPDEYNLAVPRRVVNCTGGTCP